MKWVKKLATVVRKYWRKVKLPGLPKSLPFRKDGKTPTATTDVTNTSRDGLADNAPSPANLSLEMEEIENNLHANAALSEN